MTTYFNHNSLTVGRVNPYDQPDHKKTVFFTTSQSCVKHLLTIPLSSQ